MKILVIEDENKILCYLSAGLRQEGYAVDAVSLGSDGLLLSAQHPYDLVLLDLMLPDASGYDVLKKLKALPAPPPVIIVSAKGSSDDRVKGLDWGADDFMTKPISFVELCGRIRAILRRRESGGARQRQELEIRVGEFTFDRITRQLKSATRVAELTARETLLLEYLVQNQGLLVNKRLILEHVWNFEASPQTNVVDVLICRLREKLFNVCCREMIRTVRGLGYIFDG